jgi:hypothetical protein
VVPHRHARPRRPLQPGQPPRIETNQADELQEGGQELLESLDDRWGPPQNRGVNRYPCCSWITILSLYILKVGLQKRFGGPQFGGPHWSCSYACALNHASTLVVEINKCVVVDVNVTEHATRLVTRTKATRF